MVSCLSPCDIDDDGLLPTWVEQSKDTKMSIITLKEIVSCLSPCDIDDDGLINRLPTWVEQSKDTKMVIITLIEMVSCLSPCDNDDCGLPLSCEREEPGRSTCGDAARELGLSPRLELSRSPRLELGRSPRLELGLSPSFSPRLEAGLETAAGEAGRSACCDIAEGGRKV